MTLRFNSGQASYVLVGDLDSKNNFVSDLIKKESIPSYNLFDYQETLRIPHVREIKKLLSTKAVASKRRLFIIRDATLEAQNALLKTLEELPEDASFIFLNEAILIPTILSRARILNFKRENATDEILLNMLRKIIDGRNDISSTLLLSDELFVKTRDLNFANLISSLREVLLEQIREGSFEKIGLTLRLLKSLYKYLPLVENNNLNKRILIERILINEICTPRSGA